MSNWCQHNNVLCVYRYMCVSVKIAVICLQARNSPCFGVQFIPIRLPDTLPIFELLVSTTDEVPQLCIGATESTAANPNSPQLEFELIQLNDVLWLPPGMPPGLSFGLFKFDLQLNLNFFFSRRWHKEGSVCYPNRQRYHCYCPRQ